jgi:hypothetical protein
MVTNSLFLSSYLLFTQQLSGTQLLLNLFLSSYLLFTQQLSGTQLLLNLTQLGQDHTVDLYVS